MLHIRKLNGLLESIPELGGCAGGGTVCEMEDCIVFVSICLDVWGGDREEWGTYTLQHSPRLGVVPYHL